MPSGRDAYVAAQQTFAHTLTADVRQPTNSEVTPPAILRRVMRV
jgi:hypothetical protein